AHDGLAAELAFGADLARHARDLRGKRRQLIDHRVDGDLQLQDLAAHVDGDLLRQIAVGDGRRHLGDVAHLPGQVRRHEVDRVGQVLPRAGHAGHHGLSAELAFGADLARHARDLGGERAQLIDHRVDRVLELEDLALDVDGDFLAEVAVGDRRGHLGDVAHLPGQVRRHEVDVVGQVLPHARHAAHIGLPAELTFRADLARDAGDLGGERVELIDHDVDRVLQLEHFAFDVDGDLLRQIAPRDRRRDVGDVAHLPGQVRRHAVDVVGQVLPHAADARHHRLPAELAFGADLARHARDLRGERAQLIDHRVDRVLELEHLAFDVDGDLLAEVAGGDRGGDVGDVAHLPGQVRRHAVDVVGQVLPHAADAGHLRLSAELALGADLARHARDLGGKRRQLIDHDVDRVLQLEDLALGVGRDLLRQIAARDRGGDVGDVAHLPGQVRRHEVDVVGQVLPGAADAFDLGLPAELALGADLTSNASDFGSKRRELVDHRVDRVLELEDLALGVGRDLLAEVAVGDRGGDLGDVAHLPGQVVRHQVDVVRQVLPRARHARDLGLPAELAVGADLARHARDLAGERVEVVDHLVDGHLQLEDLAAHVDRDLLRQVAVGDRGGDLGDVAHLRREARRHRVDRVGQVLPRARHALHFRLPAEAPVGADLARDARDLRRERAELIDHRVDRVLQLEDLALGVGRDLLAEIAV